MYHGEDKLDVRLSGPGSEKTISSSYDGSSSNNKQTGHGIISSQPPAAVHSAEPEEQDSSEAMGVHRPVLTSSTAQHGIPGMSRDSDASQNANIIPGTSPEFKEELLSTRLLEPDQTLTLDSQLQTHVWQSSQSPCVKDRSPEVVNAALLETGHELSEACFAEHALDSPVAYRLQHSLSECPSNQIETVVENSLEVVQQECSLSSFENFLTKADLPTTLESGELGSLQEDFVVSHDMEQDNPTSEQLTSTVTISEPHSTPSSVCPEESGDVKNIEQATELLEKSRLSGLICEHDQSEMQKLRVIHREQVSELYFLQRGGNMVDLQIFLKKPPPQPLQLFLQEKSLDDVEEEGSSETISASSGHAVSIQHHPAAAVLTSGNSEGPTIHNTTSLAKQASPEGIGPLRSSSRTAALVSSPGSTRVTRQHCSLTSEAGSTGVPVSRNLQTSLPGSHSTGTRGHASSQPRSLSISSVCASAIDGKDDIAERAKQEADIQQRVAHLKKTGLWSLKKLTRVTEPPRPKTHRDYLLEEMQWLAGDFAQERRWKRALAKKLARTVVRFHEEQKQKEERAKKEELSKLRRIAANIAKEVKYFWTNIEKVVQFKQQSLAEEKRKKALDKQLNYIVDQTEKYSDWLSRGLNNSIATSHTGSLSSSPARTEAEDGDFEPTDESDDEETIAQAEREEAASREARRREIELLRREGELSLEELLDSLPPEMLTSPWQSDFRDGRIGSRQHSRRRSGNLHANGKAWTPTRQDDDDDDDGQLDEAHCASEEGDVDVDEDTEDDSVKEGSGHGKRSDSITDDDEFDAEDEDDEDVEETIEEQEGVEDTASYQQELDELAREGEMPLEDLYKMYASAYEEQADEVVSEPALIVEDVGEEVEVKEMEPKSQKEVKNEDNKPESVDSPTISNRDENEDQEMEGDEEGSDLGMKFLVTDDKEPQSQAAEEGADGVGPKKEITDIAAAAESLQPKGYTLATAQVKTPVPFLLRGSLREYQHIGLDWLVTMNEKMLNGILADEMGLGKTIQTIALLGHLACDRGNWGPHLVVVPTSVMLNWEMEFKRWFPAFKILTYYGVPKERKQKRQGWTRPNAFHVCITSYKLVLQDHQAFRRKKWKYLILDEAQNIKNFKSQRWQSLLNFNSQHRLLLTGTPLQNSLMELWSLMHFLMPHVFQSHREFREWFSNPLTGMIEGSQEYNESLVKRLHKVLRPFLLRRIKMDVEKQMPKKYEHIVRCRLSKRQRYLYDDFMSQATTRETLASGHFMSVINILMQLRKVCNHPNLFDPRPITSPFITQGICYTTASLVLTALEYDPWRHVDLSIFDLVNAENQLSRYEAEVFLPNRKVTRKLIEEISTAPDPPPRPKPVRMKVNRMVQPVQKSEGRTVVMVNAPKSLVQNSLQKPLPSTATDGILPTSSPAAVAQRLIAGVSTEQLPSPGLPQRLLQGVVPEAAGAAHVYSVAAGQKSVGAVERVASPAVVVQRQALGAIIDTTRPVAPLAQPPVPVAPRLISELTQHAASPTMQRLAPGIAIDGTQAMLQAQRVTQGLTAEGTQLTAATSPTLLRLSQGLVIDGTQRAPTVHLQGQPQIRPTTHFVTTQGTALAHAPRMYAAVPIQQHQASGGQIIRNAASAVNPAVATTLTPTSSPVNPTNPLRLVAQASHMAPLAIQGQRAQLVTGYTLPSGVVQQRVVLTPHTQARLPSGEVISIAQLAALANSQGQAGQPLTLHIQGNKLTLACSPIRTLAPGPQHIHIQGGVVHMVKPVSQTQVLAQPGNTKIGMATLPQQQLAGAAISMPARSIAVPVATSTGSAGLVRQVVPAAAHAAAAATATLGAAPRPSTAAVCPPVRLPFVPAPHAPPARMLTQSSGTPLLRVPTVTPVASPQVAKPGLKAVPAAAPLTRGPTTRSVDRKATAEEAPSKRKDSASAAEAPAPKKPAKRSPLYLLRVEELRAQRQQDRLERIHRINEARCAPKPIYGTEVLRMCDLSSSAAQAGSRPHRHEGAWRWSGYVHCRSVRQCCKPSHPDVYWSQTSTLQSLCINSEQRLRELKEIIERFIFVVPPVESPPISLHAPHPPPSMLQKEKALWQRLHEEMSPRSAGLHRILCNMRTQFPDLRLIQYDCGKLQTLDILLRKFKAGSHRVLIFTQMTRMLDVLEQFLNFHGYIYLRLDGTTRVEQRQFLMDRFNADARIFCFILSTRSGGVGVNLTGADTVVFYDSDWNPTMDAQAQDRCHRIGQTRDVHIYRLISERTVEENILKKANQKRMLGDVAIEGGNFTTAYFKQQTIRELFEMPVGMEDASKKEAAETVPKQAPSTEEDGAVPSKDTNILELALGKAEDEEDIRAASQARAEQVAELAEFNENAADDGEEGGVGGEGRDEEEPSKAEEEINALVQQLTPIERYALKYLEASIAAETEEPKSTKEQANVSKQDVKLTKADEPKGDDAAKEIQTQETQPEDDALAKTRKRGRPCRRSDTSQAADSSQEIDQSDAVPHDESDMTIDKPDLSELLESASNCTQELSEASDRACENLHSPANLQQGTSCSFAEQNSKASGSDSAMSGHPEESQPASAPSQGREELLDAHKGDVLEEGATKDSMMENCCTVTVVATSPFVSGVREIDDSELSTRSVMTHADAAGTRDCTNESLESTPENPKQHEDSAAKCMDALETLESPHFDKENQTLHATTSADNKFTSMITSQELKLKNDILKQTDTISPNLDVPCVINANCVNPSVRDEQLNSPVLIMEDPSDSASPVAKDVEQADLPATGNLDASAEICNNGSSSSLTVNESPSILEVSTQQRAGSSPVTDVGLTDDLEVANIQRQSNPQAEALPAGPADDGSGEVEAAEVEKPLKQVLREDTPSGCDAEDSENAVDGRELPDVKPVMKEERMGKPGRKRKTDLNAIVQSHTECQDSATGKEKPRSPIRTRSGIKSRDTKRSSGMLGARRRLNLRSSSQEVNKREKNKSLSRKDLETQKKAGHSDVVKRRVGRPAKIKSPSEHINSSDGETQLYKHNMTGSSPGKDLNQSNSDDQEPQAKILCRQEVDSDDRTSADEAGMPSLPSETCVEGGRSSTPTITRASLRRSVLCQSPARTVDKATRKRRRSSQAASGDERLSGSDSLCISGSDVGAGRTRGGSSSSASRRSPSQAAAALNRRLTRQAIRRGIGYSSDTTESG